MNTNQTLQQMQQLRLQGMYLAYRSQLELPMDQQLEGHDLVAHLLQSEELNRANEKTAYYLKLAKFRMPASVDQIECSAARNLTRQQLAVLAEGRYLFIPAKLTPHSGKLTPYRWVPTSLYSGILTLLISNEETECNVKERL
ncbi:MAG TPA: ATP-binding protein [Saprospiraceae bacterium]|nr:ATP-binding protein [Saprospiraceae bacterium]